MACSPTSRRLLLALAFVGTALAGCGRGPGVGAYRGAPVVLISIDTLRADHLPAYGYAGVATPAIDALARDGVVFEHAYSPLPLTLPSHCTMLTGLLPPNHGVRDNTGYTLDTERHPDLPLLLKAAGYATGAFVSSFVLRPDSGISAGFDAYDSVVVSERGSPFDLAQRAGAETREAAVAWLRETVREQARPQAREPFFLFFHLYEPHTPWTPPEPFKSRYAAMPYDGEIASADAEVGALLDELKSLGVYDRALVLLVGDHGEGLGEHGEGHHGVMLYRSTLHVPMIVKLPKQERGGTRVADPVGLVDLAPTVVSLAGVESDAKFDGRSLFAPSDPKRELYAESYYPRLHYGWSDLQAVYDANWSLIDGPTPELFDLRADPKQQHNVLLDNRRELARLRAVVAKWNRPLAAPEEVDAETAAKLTALGYISGPPINSSETKLPDPRSQRHLLAPIERGVEAMSAENWSEAEAALREALAMNSEMYDLWLMLGRALERQEKLPQAVVAAKRALTLSGGSSELALSIAEMQFELENHDDARALAESVRATRRKDAEDLIVQIDIATGRYDEAQEILDAAARDGELTEGMALQVARQRLSAAQPQRALDLLAPFGEDAEAPTLVARARALSDLGRHQEALATLELAQRKEDGMAKLHEARGIVLLRLERAAEARQDLERALAIDPELPDSWNTLGVALYRLEGPQPAMTAWKKAIALDSEQFEALFNLGLVAFQNGDRAEARRALRQFAARAPQDRFGADIARARATLAQLGGAEGTR
jgi:arylsulfatase A-like enzyme/Tfp pilus assembly protein PilF